MINKILTLPIILLLAGCGASSSNESSTPSDLKDVNMVQSVAYSVYPGNKIIRHTNNTIVQVIHTDEEKSSIVVLQEGNATIIRNP